jgi:serine O-acetyltransferase
MAIQPIAIKADNDAIWQSIREETDDAAKQEPILASFLYSTILNHQSLECALSFHLANKMDTHTAPAMMVR